MEFILETFAPFFSSFLILGIKFWNIICSNIYTKLVYIFKHSVGEKRKTLKQGEGNVKRGKEMQKNGKDT